MTQIHLTSYVNAPLAVLIFNLLQNGYFFSQIIIFVFKDLTGMSPKSPYEEPRHPELSLDTVSNTIDKTVNYVIEFLVKQVRLLLQCPHT